MKRNKILLISIISICLVLFLLIMIVVIKSVRTQYNIHSTNDKSNYSEIKFQSDEEILEQKEIEENFLTVFKKYYGKKETEELFEEIRNEVKSNSYNSQKFPKSRREVFLYYNRYN